MIIQRIYDTLSIVLIRTNYIALILSILET